MGLTRALKLGDRLIIGEAVIEFVDKSGKDIRIKITAPPDVLIRQDGGGQAPAITNLLRDILEADEVSCRSTA